jgi:hypothetical protein
LTAPPASAIGTHQNCGGGRLALSAALYAARYISASSEPSPNRLSASAVVKTWIGFAAVAVPAADLPPTRASRRLIGVRPRAAALVSNSW